MVIDPYTFIDSLNIVNRYKKYKAVPNQLLSSNKKGILGNGHRTLLQVYLVRTINYITEVAV